MELYDLQKFPENARLQSFEEVMILEKRGLKLTSFGRNPISEMGVFYLFVFANCNCLGKNRKLIPTLLLVLQTIDLRYGVCVTVRTC